MCGSAFEFVSKRRKMTLVMARVVFGKVKITEACRGEVEAITKYLLPTSGRHGTWKSR